MLKSKMWLRAVSKLMGNGEESSKIMDTNCDEGHIFSLLVEKIATKLYNLFCKNSTNVMNSKQSRELQEIRTNKREQGQRKAIKLASGSSRKVAAQGHN